MSNRAHRETPLRFKIRQNLLIVFHQTLHSYIHHTLLDRFDRISLRKKCLAETWALHPDLL